MKLIKLEWNDRAIFKEGHSTGVHLCKIQNKKESYIILDGGIRITLGNRWLKGSMDCASGITRNVLFLDMSASYKGTFTW